MVGQLNSTVTLLALASWSRRGHTNAIWSMFSKSSCTTYRISFSTPGNCKQTLNQQWSYQSRQDTDRELTRTSAFFMVRAWASFMTSFLSRRCVYPHV